MMDRDLIDTAIEQRDAALNAELKMGALCKRLRREIEELKKLVEELRKEPPAQAALPLTADAVH